MPCKLGSQWDVHIHQTKHATQKEFVYQRVHMVQGWTKIANELQKIIKCMLPEYGKISGTMWILIKLKNNKLPQRDQS
jgi:hypothetical protein